MASSRNTTPGWLKWVVLIFIAYAAYLHFTGKGGSSDGIPVAQQKDGATVGQAVTGGTTVSGLQIPNDIEGSGDAASCGQSALVRVTGRRQDGQTFLSLNEPQTVAVGVPRPNQPWAEGVLGMKTGGVREIRMKADERFPEEQREALKLTPNETLRFTLQLDGLSPSAPADGLGFRAMDMELGKGTIAYCGMQAELHLTIWGPDGRLRYSSQQEGGTPLTVTIGRSELFYGLDRALINMRSGGIRTVIVPPAYLAAPAEPAEDAPHLPDDLARDQVMIADIRLLSVTRPSSTDSSNP